MAVVLDTKHLAYLFHNEEGLVGCPVDVEFPEVGVIEMMGSMR